MSDETINQQFERLNSSLHAHKPWLVITGAGISLSSGIPTYRDDKGNWLRSAPIQHQEFINDEQKRKRYWARSLVGWPPVAHAKPSETHHLLTEMHDIGLISGVITQNVDRLHQKAGLKNVIDLHGRLDRVVCLQCKQYENRDSVQTRLIDINPELEPLVNHSEHIVKAPDGDAYVEDKVTESIKLVNCKRCQGVIMPDVVFFGGSVPKHIHEQTNTLFTRSQGLLVLGSSLMVYSSYRFCKLAKQHNKPLVIINRGKTRADELADVHIKQDCTLALKHCLEKPFVSN